MNNAKSVEKARQGIEKFQRKVAVALFKAVYNRDVKAVEALLSEGTEADTWGYSDREGNLPLQVAAQLGGIDGLKIVQLLLAAGADIDYQGGYSATALHRAIYEDHEDDWRIARHLVRAGASLTLSDGDSLNPAESATEMKDYGAVLAMLDEGMSVDLKGCVGTLLWYASWASPELVRELIRRGADVHARANNGETPLHRAARAFGVKTDYREVMEVIRILTESGASWEAVNNRGFTPWDSAENRAAELRALVESERLTASEKHGRTEMRRSGRAM